MLKQILFAILLAYSYAEGDKSGVEVEEGVLVLNSNNFDDALKDHEFVLVEFYAPWCGHCKNLAPEYAKAAQALEADGSPAKLAKVDATIDKELAAKYGVRGYPTLKFFRDGAVMDYGGGRTEKTIVSWVKKKSGPPAATIKTKEEAEKLLTNQVAVIGFFKNVESDEAKAYLKAASQIDDYEFGICSEEELMKEYNMEKEGVALFKKFDEKRADKTEDFTLSSIREFIEQKAVALLTEFTQENSQKLFAKPNGMPFMFLVMSKKSEDFEKISNTISKIAGERRGKFRAVFLNTDNKQATQVINFLSVPAEDHPAIRILNLEKSLKYKPEDNELSMEKVEAFVDGYLNGELKPYLKSEEVPENWDAENVKVLVGKNFKEVALDDSKHVFVEFYAPWCGHCKKLTPIWDELAAKYADVDDVIIAKMDSTVNEIEEVRIQGFPTLKLFPANSNGEVVDYKGGRTLDDFVKFLSKYSELPKEEEKEEEKAPETPEEVKEEEPKKQKVEL